MFADVWGKRDFVAAAVVLAAVALIAVGQWLDLRVLTIAGGLVAVAGMTVLIAWRVIGGPDERRKGDRWV